MSKPDWTKAPDGATHWSPKDDEFKSCWWRNSDYVWECIIDNGYDKSWDSVTSMPSALIDRDTNKPTWNGPEDGLPPVGTRCMGRPDEKPDYCECIVIWNPPATQDGDHTSVALFDNDTTPLWCSDFRPLRTEEDKAVEEMASTINDGTHTSDIDHAIRIARALYRAGYRKEKQQ